MLSKIGNEEKKQQFKKPPFIPVLVKDFNIRYFRLGDLDVNNERNKLNMIAFPRYNEKNLVFQTPEFTISQYGIPGEMFAKLPIQRKTLKLPLDDQPECKLMETMFTQIDTWMKKEQAKTFSVGNLNKLKFSYKSIVREPRVDTVIEDPKKKNIKQEPINAKPRVPKCKFWKAKLDLEFPSEDIQTIVYLKDPTNPNDKPQRVYDVKSADDLEKYMPWGSKVRLIVMMNKMWAEKNPKDGDSDVRKFGLTFKVLSIETTPRQKK